MKKTKIRDNFKFHKRAEQTLQSGETQQPINNLLIGGKNRYVTVVEGVLRIYVFTKLEKI